MSAPVLRLVGLVAVAVAAAACSGSTNRTPARDPEPGSGTTGEADVTGGPDDPGAAAPDPHSRVDVTVPEESGDPDANGSITGQVVDALTGQPVEADVTFMVQVAPGGTAASIFPDDDGGFRFGGLPEGTYSITVTPRQNDAVDHLTQHAIPVRGGKTTRVVFYVGDRDYEGGDASHPPHEHGHPHPHEIGEHHHHPHAEPHGNGDEHHHPY